MLKIGLHTLTALCAACLLAYLIFDSLHVPESIKNAKLGFGNYVIVNISSVHLLSGNKNTGGYSHTSLT